ncbi:hypothetical protein CO168_02100 [Candidatus Shapirobacteria bacterium CG_4_9_14_3_um_filter_36_12]|nr:MAG: hypothetical protein AUK05_03150 [Candidatus Shapirobacteria bacterium CG2_30_35_20]PIX68305.1 MAG: hypothetical protein COZ41_00430 [Candidatus Shapirobacteria bacterium CG_4_10_14_3_um_filter_35_13]PJA51009.1 MAG: hypothetical protein CO168_02100 [Candidatus Shapirobacteria bacterium CG_4_9_14_3_um_filter_36_12]
MYFDLPVFTTAGIKVRCSHCELPSPDKAVREKTLICKRQVSVCQAQFVGRARVCSGYVASQNDPHGGGFRWG